MLRPIVKPPLDPLAHQAAIDAMEAQRAAYRRYARTVEAQRATLGDGDGDRAVAAVDAATRDFVALTEGAHRLQPLLQDVRERGSADQLQEMQRQMEQLMREARQAENAIRNLTTQLEAWRDAYGRQLAELGLVPGQAHGDEAGGVGATAGGEAAQRYARPGFGARAQTRGGPSLIDRKG